jgi:hypothetical protein
MDLRALGQATPLIPLADKRTLKFAALAAASLIACLPGHAQQAAPTTTS